MLFVYTDYKSVLSGLFKVQYIMPFSNFVCVKLNLFRRFIELTFAVKQFAVITFIISCEKAQFIISQTAYSAYPFRLSSLIIPYPISIDSVSLLNPLKPKSPIISSVSFLIIIQDS